MVLSQDSLFQLNPMRGPCPQSRFVRLGKITAGYGVPTEQENFHGGIDIAAAAGSPIKAPVDGVITKVDGSHSGVDNSFGNQVELKDMEGNVHQFNHLQNIVPQKGQRLRKGQVVATIGATGAVYSPSGSDPSNLDYRIMNSYHQYMNPTEYAKHL